MKALNEKYEKKRTKEKPLIVLEKSKTAEKMVSAEASQAHKTSGSKPKPVHKKEATLTPNNLPKEGTSGHRGIKSNHQPSSHHPNIALRETK